MNALGAGPVEVDAGPRVLPLAPGPGAGSCDVHAEMPSHFTDDYTSLVRQLSERMGVKLDLLS